MKVQAITKNVRISPRKVRIVADAVKVLPVQEAIYNLRVMRRRAALVIAKTLESAVANAIHNNNMDKNNLKIADINVAEGQAIKRFHPSTRGRIHPYKKRSSHIRVILEDVKTTEVTKKKLIKEKEEANKAKGK